MKRAKHRNYVKLKDISFKNYYIPNNLFYFILCQNYVYYFHAFCFLLKYIESLRDEIMTFLFLLTPTKNCYK